MHEDNDGERDHPRKGANTVARTGLDGSVTYGERDRNEQKEHGHVHETLAVGVSWRGLRAIECRRRLEHARYLLDPAARSTLPSDELDARH